MMFDSVTPAFPSKSAVSSSSHSSMLNKASILGFRLLTLLRLYWYSSSNCSAFNSVFDSFSSKSFSSFLFFSSMLALLPAF